MLSYRYRYRCDDKLGVL